MIFFILVFLLSLSVVNGQPEWSDNSTNSTESGEAVEFRLKWADDIGLSGYVFSTNNTGTWENETWTPFDFWTDNFDNADDYQITPTYEGSNESAHPDVLYFPDGWGNDANGNAWKYWMAMVPLPDWSNSYERPSILVSNNSLTWQVPAGLTNPIDIPQGVSDADPELYYDASSDVLWIYYIDYSSSNFWLRRRNSTDGINWGSEETILTTGYPELMSPTLLEESGVLYMWTVNGSGGQGSRSLELRTSTDGGKSWSSPIKCSVTGGPSGYDIWHPNVNYNNELGVYWMLMTYRQDYVNHKLRFLESTDKVNWQAYDFSDIGLDPSSSGWDNQDIYRSAGIIDETSNTYHLWYSACNGIGSWTGGYNAFHIGYTNATYGGAAWSNVIKTLNPTPGVLVQWKVYANDTNNNWNESEVFSLVTTGEGITTTTIPMISMGPQYSDNSTSSTFAAKPVEFRLKWTDDIGVSGYIFSFDDATGNFVNDSWREFYLRPSSYSTFSDGNAFVINPTNAWDNGLYDNSTHSTLNASAGAGVSNQANLIVDFTNVSVDSMFYYTWAGSAGGDIKLYLMRGGSWSLVDSTFPTFFVTESRRIREYYLQDGVFQALFVITGGGSGGNVELKISDLFISGESIPNGTRAWSNVTKVVDSTVGEMIRWKVYANNTSDGWNVSDEFSFMTTDGAPPQWSDNSTNFMIAGQPIEFRLRWTDNIGLDSYIFSLDNCIGSFANITKSTFPIGGTEDWSNVTQIIDATVGCTIRWKFYANDTNNNWNVSDGFSFVSVYELPPEWSNLRHEPSNVTESDPVDIKVEWFDYEYLDTVIIYENSTGAWEEHVCNLVTGVCSGEILGSSFFVFLGMTSTFISLAIIRAKKRKLSGKFKTVLTFTTVILIIFLISMLLFPEIPERISKTLMRLGIIPMAVSREFTHTIPASNLDVGEVVGYYSYANDSLGNENTTENRTFIVRGITSYLVGYWNFDEGSGNMTYDSSDYGNNGTLGDGTCSPGSGTCPNWTSDCHSGSCLNFDGVDDYVFVSNSPSLAFDYDTFTILVWVKTLDNYKVIFDKYDWSVAIAVWDYANFYMWADVGSDVDLYSTTNISDGGWHHIAAVRDKPNNIVRLFVDGVEEANATDGVTAIDTTGDIYIGSSYWVGEYFNGTIDEVKVYNNALSAEGIMSEYLHGVPVTTTTTSTSTTTSTTTTTPTETTTVSDGGNGDVTTTTPNETNVTTTTVPPATTTTPPVTTTTIATPTTSPPATTRACASTGQACSSDTDCCYGYCCDNVCSDEECEEVAGINTMYIALIVIGALIPTGYFIYTKVLGKKIPFGFKPSKPSLSVKLQRETAYLRMASQRLKVRGYNVAEAENELTLADNAFRKGLKKLATSHLKRAREILERISRGR